MRKIFQRLTILLGIVLACLLGGNVWALTEEVRSPIAIARPTPILVGQFLKDPESLIRVNYTPEAATAFAWRTFLAFYSPDCIAAPVADKKLQKGVLYSAILLLMYNIVYDVRSKERSLPKPAFYCSSSQPNYIEGDVENVTRNAC
ncbi:hypothetical protein [Spirulina sp. 06S082]|uniref:hypothetical protein n=1 Tax=Spirulina sp. 06S082 TaxID=3110248 RepID=UPI002B20FDEB|nr:hypothetical protein [Spirulina sp. 06S082]MEA5472128.1 hypothetical protein [Spirulina sp. 06S082]